MNVLRGLQHGAVGRRYTETLRAGTLFARSLAAASSSSSPVVEKEEHGGLFSSWVGKIKGAFQSKPPSPQSEEQPTSALTLLACADELKNARRLSTFSSFLKMSPHVPEGAATESVEKCEKMMRAVAKHNPTGQNVDEKQKEAAAKECGCTLKEINTMLTNFERMKEARAKLLQMKEKGEELPKTMAEFQKVLNINSPQRDISQSQSADVGRNAPCTCGSGKKYKRCCGRGT